MNFDAIPRLRLEIEGIKHSIIAHIGAMDSELGDALSVEINKAVENYPWEQEVMSIVHDKIRAEISSYFKYGAGAKSINEAVDDGFKRVNMPGQSGGDHE